jgi:hypothetical protein
MISGDGTSGSEKQLVVIANELRIIRWILMVFLLLVVVILSAAIDRQLPLVIIPLVLLGALVRAIWIARGEARASKVPVVRGMFRRSRKDKPESLVLNGLFKDRTNR